MAAWFASASCRHPFFRSAAVAAGVAATAAFVAPAAAGNNEPAACLSPDPSQWPAPAKPYFMLAVDTGSAMADPLPLQTCGNSAQCVAASAGTTCTCFGGGAPPCAANSGYCSGIAPPCAGYASTRSGHERCALDNTINAFSGQVNFGLAGFAMSQTSCNGALTCGYSGPVGFSCFTNCSYASAPGDPVQTPGATYWGCGPITGGDNGGDPTTRRGANVLVPMLQDHFWSNPPAASNVATLLSYVDNSGAGNTEMWARGYTPINGMLRDMYRYFAGTYVNPVTGVAVPSPLDTSTPSNERACRSVNVILISAGDENCDTYPDAEAAATNLYNGVTVGGITWSIRTHVIAFVGGKNAAAIAGTNASSSQTGTDTGHGYYANPTNSVALSQALANIIGSAIQPETCDNVDNNCNGCTDEGFSHYCDLGQTCCADSTPAQRAACLASYQASITASLPQGDVTLLPCTDVNAGGTPSTWLCYNPGDVCDGVDNNCNGQIDEGALKCGSPLHCPVTETCNGQDDNCDGIVDNAPGSTVAFSACPAMCQPSPEICDGCDNDCNGIVDDNVPNAACGVPPNPPQTPAYCAGTLQCISQGMVTPGTCVAGGGKTQCVFPAPGAQPETCDGIDNDCDGIVDEDVPSTACIPGNFPAGLVYGGTSQCKMGMTQCINGMTQCVGAVGPSQEVCDGVDNDCNGVVDDNVPGLGQACGSSLGACKPGKVVCLNGALTCTGGVGPTPEICDGIDNDCDGLIDNGALADAPANPGCWNLMGSCCSYVDVKTNKTTTWCPPTGATCTGLGTLASPPCAAGKLVCQNGGWACSGAKDPSQEICDGIDNDCDGTIDEGPLPSPVNDPCGSSVGACQTGTNQCVNGTVTCSGVGPTAEICDGIDNDCDGTVDEDVPGVGMPCPVQYDTTKYPGQRTSPPCHPGVTVCSGVGGVVCEGGQGPSPEICDGLDNDCDGKVDEAGTQPDGITGTANPADMTQVIGQACGMNQGVCKAGVWACSSTMFVCSGGVLPTPETCDCKDNDCDGTVDEANPNNMPPLCPSGSACVQSAAGCGCATPCSQGEFPCPGGQQCVTVMIAGMPSPTNYCVNDACGNGCSTATAHAPGGAVICAPAGASPDPTTCVTPPVCVCQGLNVGCKNPCFGVTCTAGTVCTDYGANAGKCVAVSCFNTPCAGCQEICSNGTCMQGPCTSTTCSADQECKPSADGTTSTCLKPCASVLCGSGQSCVDGACVDGCSPACDASQVCDTTQSPPVCVTDKCNPSPCTDLSCCNPVTGTCGTCPCDDVVCPTGSVCSAGQCISTNPATSSSSSASSSASSSGAGGNGAGGGGVWGLATGGGGCFCGVGPGAGPYGDARWALVAAALLLGRARRRRTARAARAVQGGEVAR